MNPEPLTPDQQSAFDALEHQSGEWGSLAWALQQKGEAVSVPAPSPSALAQLETIRTQAFAAREKAPRLSSSFLRLAAVIAILAGLAWFFLPRHSPNADIVILSPRGDNTGTQPVISWKAQPGKSYDVWILPPEGDVLNVPAVFKAEKVRPPVDFMVLSATMESATALTPGADYRVLVCFADTNRIGGIAIPFKVKPSSPPP